MTIERARRGRRWSRWLGAAAVGALVLTACSSDWDANDATPSDLPAGAQAIVDSEAFAHGSWTYQVLDPQTGEVVYGNRDQEVAFLGSTTKLFTVGTYLDQVGPDATLETPVYATGDRSGSVLDGDLVVVGSGDFVLGSRDVGGEGLQWNEPDHVYYYATPLAAPVEADPLAGLDDLAAQVAASGIGRVAGDVLVDDRLWEPYESKEGVVTAMTVNDNLLDVAVTPGGAEGDAAVFDVRPATQFFDVVNRVETVAADGESDVTATVEGDQVVVEGTIALGADTYHTAAFAPDPATYARGLFIEALQRAGVAVDAPLDAARSTLPDAGSYADADKVASLTSPTAAVLSELVLKTSHNRGAETLMCLLAVQADSDQCQDGLTTMLDTVGAAGVDQKAVFLFDGEGSDPASASPAAVVGWLEWAEGRPWGEVFRDGLPDVLKDGTVLAKSGTSARPQNPPMGALFVVQAEAGYMTGASGRQLVVAVYANDGVYPTVAEGLQQSQANIKAWLEAVRDAS